MESQGDLRCRICHRTQAEGARFYRNSSYRSGYSSECVDCETRRKKFGPPPKPPQEKRCTKCGRSPSEGASFHRKSKAGERLQAACRDCQNADERARRAARNAAGPKIDPDIIAEERCCTKCKRTIADGAVFHKSRFSLGGLKSRCKDCENADRTQRRRAAGIPARRTTEERWERKKEMARKWRRANGEHIRLQARSYRARIRALHPLPPRWSVLTRDDQGRKQCGKCWEWKTPEGNFGLNRRFRDGLSSECKACRSKRLSSERYRHMKRVWIAKNRTRVQAASRRRKNAGRPHRGLILDPHYYRPLSLDASPTGFDDARPLGDDVASATPDPFDVVSRRDASLSLMGWVRGSLTEEERRVLLAFVDNGLDAGAAAEALQTTPERVSSILRRVQERARTEIEEM